MSEAPIAEIVALLDRAGLDYMIVGSHASMFHGAPRSTQDLDIVVELRPASLGTLLQLVDRERFYVPDAAARDAVENDDQFNLIDLETGWKIDVIVRHHRPFSEEEFGRRQRALIGGSDVFVASAEDTVLSKLAWAAQSGSDRQVNDAAWVLAVQGASIDQPYVDHWARELDLVELLDQARRIADGG